MLEPTVKKTRSLAGGFVMISVSIILFALAAIMADQPEPAIPEVQNLVGLAAVVCMAIGLYWTAVYLFSKSCPKCAEKLERAARICDYCGHIF